MKTIDNCPFILNNIKRGIGSPYVESTGTCLGYQRSEIDDEPCDMCKECELCSSYEESKEE